MTENFSTVILVFPQVTEVDKREPRESFLKPRLRNVPRGSLFSTEVTWTNLKSDVDKFVRRMWQAQKLKQNAFFICSGFFVNIQYPILYNAGPL